MKAAILAGSNRKYATSTALSKYIGELMQEAGWQVAFIDLYERPVPLFLPDGEETEDSNVREMKRAVSEADAVVLSTPEYHGSISGVLKNALDHMGSREFADKPVLSVSSAGGAVGAGSLTHLQSIVRNLHGINCPEWISIGGDNRAFQADGKPQSPVIQKRIMITVRYFMQMAAKLSSPREAEIHAPLA